MKSNYKKVLIIGIVAVLGVVGLTACEESDSLKTKQLGYTLSEKQPTPTDIEFSLERYNLIRRAYWVNGQREKARTLVSKVDKPLSYVMLMDHGAVVGKFVVDGKVSSLNSYLTPDSEEYAASYSAWLPDVDGSYGENDNGIFFFTPDEKYIEWTGTYLYTDELFEIKDPVITIQN